MSAVGSSAKNPTALGGQPIPVTRYAARSKTGDDTHGSADSQIKQIDAVLSPLGGRVLSGDPHKDYASGSKSNRGPALAHAIEEATTAAEHYGQAELWVFHSSRLARGTGKKGEARALGHLLYELQARGVVVRSVSDDEFTTNEQLWGIASSQSSKYSKDLSDHIRRGYREAAERGDPSWLVQGVPLGGYLVERSVDEGGRITRKATKDPESAWMYELIFEMALEGKSDQTIQLALSERGARTRPSKRHPRSKPFNANLIADICTNPAFAGLVRHKTEIVGPGQWPSYLSPEDFWRLQAERKQRSGQTKRPRGRPPGYVTAGVTIDPVTGKRQLNLVQGIPYLLRGLVRCGECGGPMRPDTSRRRRQDGERLRRYVCLAHHDFHKDSAEWCPAKPIDASVAEKLVMTGLSDLISDADTLREQLGAGRTANLERLGRVAAEAREEAERKDRVAEKAQARYERALEEDDDETAEIALAAVRRARKDAENARKRLNAARDALHTEPQEDDADVLSRVWKALSGSIADAGGDILKLNAALREWFVAFDVRKLRYTGIRVVPVISAVALARMMSMPPAFAPGRISAVAYDEDGEATYWGSHLVATEGGIPSSTGYWEALE
jgi:DNA invertase Pin-like site-specific DNA recombinase